GCAARERAAFPAAALPHVLRVRRVRHGGLAVLVPVCVEVEGVVGARLRARRFVPHGPRHPGGPASRLTSATTVRAWRVAGSCCCSEDNRPNTTCRASP